MNSLLRACFVLALYITSACAQALPVNIQANGFDGQFYISGQTGYISGDQTLDMPAGSYSLSVAGSDGFRFELAADGSITTDNPDAATGGMGTLGFNVTPVTIDPGNFDGDTRVNRVIDYFSAPVTVNLVKGISYSAIPGGSSNFRFFVAADELVSAENGISATGGPNTITFNTMPVTIDPADFSGQSRINRIDTGGYFSAPVTPQLVPGVSYSVIPAGTSSFRFYLAADGTTTITSSTAAQGGAGTVTFNTVPITVDPADFSGETYITRVTSYFSAPVSLKLVPDSQYSAVVGGYRNFRFNVESNGVVTVPNGVSAYWDGAGSMVFNTSTVNVSPSDTSTFYYINRVIPNSTGDVSVQLVPGVEYRFISGSLRSSFTVGEPCSVNPPSILLGTTTFSFSCGAPDTDGDGISDDVDNCPSTPNMDQVDLDGDGAGDACDADLDGDGVGNDADNCADVANPLQTDTDADGEGDACDNDVDGDLVSDDIDNCPAVPNLDQADTDTDGEGDACDVDDDNDGVDDVVDNCPLEANGDQLDSDNNGEGDACDGDVDGDSVANEADLCPLSPQGEVVNTNGCTGSQFIELSCDASDFVQHGKYVSCVAEAANQAVQDGLISNNQKGKFISQAAKKK